MSFQEQLFNSGIKPVDTCGAPQQGTEYLQPLTTERKTVEFLQKYIAMVFGWNTGVTKNSFVRIDAVDFRGIERYQMHPRIVEYINENKTTNQPKQSYISKASALCTLSIGSGSKEKRYICTVGEDRRIFLKEMTRHILDQTRREYPNVRRRYFTEQHSKALYHLDNVHEAIHYDTATYTYEIGSYRPFQQIAKFVTGESIVRILSEFGISESIEKGHMLASKFFSDITRCRIQFEGGVVSVLLDDRLVGTCGYQLTESIIDFITIGTADQFISFYFDYYNLSRTKRTRLHDGTIIVESDPQYIFLKQMVGIWASIEVGTTRNVESERIEQTVVANFLQQIGVNSPAEAMHLIGTYPPVLKYLLDFGAERLLGIPSDVPIETRRAIFEWI